jgi:hypothetical protein
MFPTSVYSYDPVKLGCAYALLALPRVLALPLPHRPVVFMLLSLVVPFLRFQTSVTVTIHQSNARRYHILTIQSFMIYSLVALPVGQFVQFQDTLRLRFPGFSSSRSCRHRGPAPPPPAARPHHLRLYYTYIYNMYIYIYTYIRMYIHTYIHACMYLLLLLLAVVILISAHVI